MTYCMQNGETASFLNDIDETILVMKSGAKNVFARRTLSFKMGAGKMSPDQRLFMDMGVKNWLEGAKSNSHYSIKSNGEMIVLREIERGKNLSTSLTGKQLIDRYCEIIGEWQPQILTERNMIEYERKKAAKKPEAAKPEAAKPEAAKPEATKPEAAKPEAAKPEAAKPEAAKPKFSFEKIGGYDPNKALEEFWKDI